MVSRVGLPRWDGFNHQLSFNFVTYARNPCASPIHIYLALVLFGAPDG